MTREKVIPSTIPHTVVVGLGRSGAGLHVPTLARLRRAHPEVFGAHRILGFDPGVAPSRRAELARFGVRAVESLDRLPDLLPPQHTVVHVCTPPHTRVAVLSSLATRGFRRLVVEKPLATDRGALTELERLREAHDLDVLVVTQWLVSTLTKRLTQLARSGEHGPLTAITVRQDKPRFARAANPAHTDAFDVEIPHSLAVALTIAGPARLTGAGWLDPDRPLGGAWLTMRHDSGTHTTIRSDLTSPVRRREITLRLRDTTVVGHYPVSGDDHHAQLWSGTAGREVFEDETLGAFLLAAYRYFTGTTGTKGTGTSDTPTATATPPGNFAAHAAVVRLLAAARDAARARAEAPARAG